MADAPLVAIVDDEESVRIALRRVCGAYGMDARAFASVLELFESLRDRHPDCLILDAHMPGIDGPDAQLWLRERGINIPTIMITGRDDDDMRARSRAAGAHAYLCKPVDADVLFGAIKNAMGTDSPAATAPSA